MSCERDEEVRPFASKTLQHRNDWSNEEKLFFDLNNDGNISGSQSILSRSDEIPEILIDVYNNIVDANEQDSFVYSVAKRIGYPIWLQSKIEDNKDTLPDIIYIPFAKRDSTDDIEAYLIGYKDYSSFTPELKLDIRLRTEIDSMDLGLISFKYYTCHDIVRFMVFDSIIFGRPTFDYDSLIEQACLPVNSLSYTNNAEITNRECVSEIVEKCYWVEDDFGDGDGGVVDWVVKPSLPTGSYGFPSSSGGSSHGTGNGPHGSLSSWTIGLYWAKLFYRKMNPNITFHDPNLIESRDETLICSDYLVIKCNRGEWWETVLEIPCDGCDVDLETEKAEHAECLEQSAVFGNKYNFTNNQRRVAVMAAMDCCSEFSVDESCAKRNYIKTALDLTDEEMECLNANTEVVDEVFHLLSGGTLFDVCDLEFTNTDILNEAVESFCANDGITLDEFYEEMNNFDYVFMDNSFLECGHLACIYNSLRETNNSLFCSTLDNFVNDPLSKLTFVSKPGTQGDPHYFSNNPGVQAYTTAINSNPQNIVINFNPNLCDDDVSNVPLLAGYMLHEAIHAKLFYDCWPSGATQDEYYEGFPECAKKYFPDEVVGMTSQQEHQLMLGYYVNIIAQAIDELMGGYGTWEDWKFIALQGLWQYSPYKLEDWFIEDYYEAKDNYEDNNFTITNPCD